MRGIILAGGSGTRLYPLTITQSKQLLPVYDKPMIYYPLSVLMLAGIREILVITTPNHLPQYKELLGSGEHLGVSIKFAIQKDPNGIAEAFIIAEEFIAGEPICLILGDNIFHGLGLSQLLKDSVKNQDGATIFGCHVPNPESFGVIEFNKKGKILSIKEKPANPLSKYAVTGLYFYDASVCQIAKNLKPSGRGELEITDINNQYLQVNKLTVKLFTRGLTWFDTGTPANLLKAANFIQTTQETTGVQIACLEEIALNNNWINKSVLDESVKKYQNSKYFQYITSLEQGDFK